MEIKTHSRSLLRFTYRSEFPSLVPYGYTTDAGWGCMLRSAQMLIGQTMQRHYLGQDWRLPNSVSKIRADKDYCSIVRWCTDYPGPSCIYAIHHIIQCGMAYDKLPGEWYGPSTASLVLRDLTRLHRRKYGGPVEVHVANGDVIYITEVESTFTAKKPSEVDPFYDEGVDDDTRRRHRRSRRKSGLDKEEDSKSDKAKPSLRRQFENQKVLVARSEDSMWSSIASHSQDLEDESYSFTNNTLSSERSCCRSRSSSVSVETDCGEDNVHEKDQQVMMSSLNIESNPFIVRSSSSDATVPNTFASSENGSSAETHSQSTWTSSGVDPMPSSHSEGKRHLSNLKAMSENIVIHDPLYNPPPTQKEEEWPASLLLLMPLRLGEEKFDPKYIPALKEFLRQHTSAGILGGQINRAIYFVGYRGDTLLGLDPHTVFKNPSLVKPFPSTEHLSQIHRNELFELPFSALDPSLALAFYFHDRFEFKAFCEETKFQNDEKSKKGQISLYHIQYAPASTEIVDFMCSESEGETDDSEDDEYVFI